MEDKWWEDKSELLQLLVDLDNLKYFFAELKSIYSAQSAWNCPILDSDGTTMLTEQTEILNWQKEYFYHMLNQPSIANASVWEQITQQPLVQEAEAEPTDVEVLCIEKSIAVGKAVGRDGI